MEVVSQDVETVARRIGEGAGPFRRTLLRASRAVADLPDLPDAQIEVLRALGAGDRSGTAPSELAERLGLARPTVSNLVSAMEHAGLVERRDAPGDGRRSTVHLTRLAARRLRAYDAATTALLVDALGRLDEEDRRAVAAALPALVRLHREIGRGAP